MAPPIICRTCASPRDALPDNAKPRFTACCSATTRGRAELERPVSLSDICPLTGFCHPPNIVRMRRFFLILFLAFTVAGIVAFPSKSWAPTIITRGTLSANSFGFSTAKKPCASQTVTWLTNCSGTVAALSSGVQTGVANTAAGYTGSVTETCNNGTLSQSGASCTALSNCTLTVTSSHTGTVPAGISGSVSYTLHGGGGGAQSGSSVAGNSGSSVTGSFSPSVGDTITVYVGGGGGGGSSTTGGAGASGWFGGGGGVTNAGGGGGSTAVLDNASLVNYASGGDGGSNSGSGGSNTGGSGYASGGSGYGGNGYNRAGSNPSGGSGGNGGSANSSSGGGGGGYGGGGGGGAASAGAGGSNGGNGGNSRTATGGTGGSTGGGGSSSAANGGNGGSAILTYQAPSCTM
jgi:hypothetical protein